MARKKDADSEAESDPAGDAVTVEITADHIYLPIDDNGNVPPIWREMPETVRMIRGTKLSVPADMLEMLGDRVKVSP
jgi:hypothetical protein